MLPGVLAFAATVALVVVSLVSSPLVGHRALGVVIGVAILCTSAAGLVTTAQAPRLGWIVILGALVAGVAAAGTRLALAKVHPVHSPAHVVAVFAALLAMALSVHGLLSLPNGVLGRRSRQVGAALWYAVAIALAAVLATTFHVLAPWPAAVGWLVAVASTLPTVQARYLDAPASGRQRMQWIAVGAALAAEVVLISVTLNLLVALAGPDRRAGRRQPRCWRDSAFCARPSPVFQRHADRLLVNLLSILGFTVVVAAIYLIVVRGLGKTPTGTTDREVLGLSIVAAAIAAVGYIPARDRFARMATRFVYGAREAPDEVVRTFGSRLTRAIPMDELLLQLAESLRKTLALQSAEVYTGSGEVLELAVSVPDRGARSLVVSARERPVITHAGVSGNAWASVWMPALLDGRPAGPIRVAPICHAGELLGTIVVARSEGAVNFSEEDDRVLTELARQVGLAFHNAQLDTALQTSLDELRRQADELRASRARIVASGDAERRRVERNLHDGAQQHLVALAVNLRLVKDIVVEDPEGAVEMLDELGSAVQDTIQELRELAHGIYPPLLVDSGLGRRSSPGCQPQPARHRAADRRDRPVRRRRRGRHLLLLPRGSAERRQARARRARQSSRVGGVRRVAVLGRRRRPRLRRAQSPARPRLCEHDGPPGRDRWLRALGVRAGSRDRDPRFDSSQLTNPFESRSSQRRRSVDGPNCSLCMYARAPLVLASAGRSFTS